MKRLWIYLASLSLATASLSAQAPKFGDVECGCIIDCLRGILLLGSWDQVRLEPVDEIDGVVADGPALLASNRSFLQCLKDKYINQPLTHRSIWELREDIAAFYQAKNQPFVVVTIPKQELTHCTLQVVVDEAKLGEVRSKGNCHFPSRWLTETIRTQPGEPILSKDVLEDVAWLNLNPFRRTDAVFTPGQKPGTTDIELITTDRWPYRVYAGADNTGTEPTNRNRLFFGFNFGKSVLKDGQISYQFTFAPNWNRFYAHTASARLPMPWRHVFVFWGGYTQIKPDLGVSGMKNKGYSWQVDGRYRIPYLSVPGLMQEFVLGYDFKESNNNLLFAGTKVFGNTADVSQFMVGYELGARTKKQRLSLLVEAYGNPGGITHSNSNRAYQNFRFDAQCQYFYLKAAHSFAKDFKYCWLTYDISGQASTANLLPSEQFTLTGYNAVRGYEERILNLDNALLINLGFESIHFSPMKNLGYCKLGDELYFLAFFDYGLGGNHKPAPGESKFKNLASIGPGIRYQMDQYITARFDYGYQLWHTGFDNPTHSRYNFGLIVSY